MTPRAKNFRRQWGKAWRLRIYGGPHKSSFDLHRAGGLWVWAMLFVLAWSSVFFNLKEVYNPVTKAPLPTQAATRFREHVPRLAEPRYEPLIDRKEALAVARRLVAEHARHADLP
ncbi:putative iron-regulated membrane protein [Sinorhizobium meliloti]|uniref:PepSY-associated TM helix domain-containing protein n=1 Tax=Rhizobium meliloti TaxID=382 RepID=UPI000FD1A846|nr:PepSY-associated TM helix domain-containing protein [Sinorhizobium meliloti]MDW9377509.1 PepSY domain-containing protein [Sinorhizobium meliloti]MDW9496023.1 PepSY domain-containing protein [Sinorhizobium meliloti]MDW9544176.1 PepSY domain-containing protein [Sinorhizobium meliloti]MDW9564385.1 PepSY domain-containing protein [Sinorhizobium meliloti]MDW9591259.1 PepSY domain-containing protein [Sinorhizobium meliloti]